MEPGLEPIVVTERPQVAPGQDERRLHGILGEVTVAEDPGRDRHAPIADRAGQGVEGLFVAQLRPVHELSVHELLLAADRSLVGSVGKQMDVARGKVQSLTPGGLVPARGYTDSVP